MKSALIHAYKAVREGGMSTLGAARLHNVPESTLRDWLHGRIDIHATNIGHPKLFTRQEESMLAELISTFGKLGYRILRRKILEMASDYCVSLKKQPGSRTLSKHWCENFIQRWPVIKDLVSNENEKKSRHVSISAALTYYYSKLEKVMSQYGFHDKPYLMYNVTDIVITQEDEMKGARPFITVLACGNADGLIMPPYFVFYDIGRHPVEDLLPRSFPGAAGVVLKDEEVDFQIFSEFLEDFIKSIPTTNLSFGQVLLLVDRKK